MHQQQSQDQARILEHLAQSKPMEVPHTSRLRERHHQFKSSKRMQSLSLQVKDWEDEASEDEAELARVQHEIERLRQEQETITRSQVAAQHTEARRQHINREGARLMEL
jgi:hypothetical protein